MSLENYIISISTVILSGCYCTGASARQDDSPPNIILILADDLGYSDIGCYGGEIETPNIDYLGYSGVRFTNFYNYSKCTPSRASIITGLYPNEAGIGSSAIKERDTITIGPHQGYLNENCVTIAEVLRNQGYYSYLSGKWGLGEKRQFWPKTRGFDGFFGLLGGAHSYFGDRRRNDGKISKSNFALEDEQWQPLDDNFYFTDQITNYGINKINLHGLKGEPFFLFLSYTAPHWPLHALNEDIEKYEGVYKAGWDVMRQRRFEKMKQLGLIGSNHKLAKRPDTIADWSTIEDKRLWERRMEVYAAMVDRMDQGIGRVIDALKQLDIFENTVIIFLSDNGASARDINTFHDFSPNPNAEIGSPESYDSYREPWAWLSNTPYNNYKTSAHEGGIITPFIVHWPKSINGGRIHRRPHQIIDILPTILELSGTDYPTSFNGKFIKPFAGKSLMPAILERDNKNDQYTFFMEYRGNIVSRRDHYKLIYSTNTKKWELFDLLTDPTELLDVIQHQQIVSSELGQEFKAWSTMVQNTEIVVNTAINSSIAIYPNPGSGDFVVELSGDLSHFADVEVLKLNGQSVLSAKIPPFFDRNKVTVDLSDQPPGIYIVHIRSYGKLVTKKFVKI